MFWCTTAIALARPPRLAIESHSYDRDVAAERVIEHAAFMKLAEVRGVDVGDLIGNESRNSDPVLRSLIEICPLSESSPVEILGQIHEHLVSNRGSNKTTSPRRKSKSRTANGVVYSPACITDYIVRHTVGERIKNMTPTEVEALTILDPAMGSGAFLLSVYRCLLAWHLDWYLAHQPDKWPDDVNWTDQGWRLTFRRCDSILRNNLFGVDLDRDAIEVARRTLWLTLFECSASANENERDCDSREGEAPAEPRRRKTHRLGGSAGASPSHVALPPCGAPCIPDETSFSALPSGASTKPNRPGHPDDVSENTNLKQGHALIGPAFGETFIDSDLALSVPRFSWPDEFPQVAARGGFDIVIGNPPYRRERNFKRELDEIGATPLGRHRSPRMDLWYYFVHRGIELLKDGGTLSYITNAYWLQGTGAGKLIATLREDVSLDELFLLRNQPVFPGVQGQHLIFRLTKSTGNQQTTIKIAPSSSGSSSVSNVVDLANVRTFVKSRDELFRDHRLDVWPPADSLLDKLGAFPRLIELGIVRQGIAENPSTINRRTVERFHETALEANWKLGEGVFSLTADEAERLNLLQNETELLRPYHDLCDIGRYWLAAQPSRKLIYSTRKTCSEIDAFPTLKRHLSRFRTILDARRETRSGSNGWWHLHWPRDERIWHANKLVVLQLAIRPSFVPAFQPTYVPFSSNVFLPQATTGEDLRYLCAVLNSRVLWAWFARHAKHRGIGLDLNGHVLAQAPIRQIDFANPIDVATHDVLVDLVKQRMNLEQQSTAGEHSDKSTFVDAIQSVEAEIDGIVATLYGLDSIDLELVNDITEGERE